MDAIFELTMFHLAGLTLLTFVCGWIAGWYFGYEKGRDEGFVAAIELLQSQQNETFDL